MVERVFEGRRVRIGLMDGEPVMALGDISPALGLSKQHLNLHFGRYKPLLDRLSYQDAEQIVLTREGVAGMVMSLYRGYTDHTEMQQRLERFQLWAVGVMRETAMGVMVPQDVSRMAMALDMMQVTLNRQARSIEVQEKALRDIGYAVDSMHGVLKMMTGLVMEALNE